MNNDMLKKCSLFIQVSNPDKVKYEILPISSDTIDSQVEFVYNVLVDVNCKPVIEIDVELCPPGEFLHIKKIVFDQIPIVDLNTISNFKTYGYIDKPGKYKIKLHTNAVSLSYLTNLLSLTKRDTNNG